LGAARFAELEVPVPGPAEQRRIVEEANRRLGHLAKSSVSMDSALQGIQDQVTTVLEATATGQLGRSAKPAAGREPTTTIEALARVSLPEGWQWVRVAEAGEPRLGRQRAPKHEQGKDLVQYLRVANVFEDRIDTSDLLSMNFTPEEQETYLLRTGDILLNEGQSAELVGRPAMYRGEPPKEFFHNTLVRFRPASTVNPEFALNVFRFYLRSGVFKSIARWSTNIAHLGLQRFGELPFPLPPREEQDALVTLAQEKLRQLDEQRAAVLTSAAGVDEMRREILTAAVRGDLSSHAAHEESAEEMLARLGPPPEEKRAGRVKDVPDDADVEDQAEEHQELTEALEQAGGKATAENLFAEAGYDRDLTTEVEGFYLSLRDSLGKTIRIAGADGGNSVIEVIPDATS
jgi:type I restriction enzyme S subunit